MGLLLIVVVVVNAFLTGWLLSQVRSMKRVIHGVARVQRDIVNDESQHDTSVDLEV